MLVLVRTRTKQKGRSYDRHPEQAVRRVAGQRHRPAHARHQPRLDLVRHRHRAGGHRAPRHVPAGHLAPRGDAQQGRGSPPGSLQRHDEGTRCPRAQVDERRLVRRSARGNLDPGRGRAEALHRSGPGQPRRTVVRNRGLPGSSLRQAGFGPCHLRQHRGTPVRTPPRRLTPTQTPAWRKPRAPAPAGALHFSILL